MGPNLPAQAVLHRVVARAMSLRVNVDSLILRASANKNLAINALIHALDLDILMLQDSHWAPKSSGIKELHI